MPSVKSNFIYNLAYQVLAIALPLLVSPYLSRVIGKSGIGEYSYTFSIAGFFLMFAMLGISNHGNRSIAEVRSSKRKRSEVFFSIYSIQLFSSLVVLAAFILFTLFGSGEYRSLMIVWIAYVLSAMFDVTWYFFGQEQFKLTVIRNCIVKIITFACVFLFVKDSDGVGCYVAITSIGFLCSQLVLWPFLLKDLDFSAWKATAIAGHIKPILVLFLPVVAVSLYSQVNKILLGAFSAVESSGFYFNAEMINAVPVTIIGALGTVMLPRMAHLVAAGDKSSVSEYIRAGVLVTSAISGLFIAGFIGVGSEFSILFWGKSFAECGIVLGILSLQLPFVAFSNVIRTQYLIPNHRDKEYVSSVLVGAVVNLLVVFLTVSSFGARGAAFGTVLAQASVLIVQALAVRTELPLIGYLRAIAPFIGLGLFEGSLIFAFNLLIEQSFATMAVEIVAISSVYFASAFLLLKRKGLFVKGVKS